jgi:homoserine dehydrogenase
MREVRLVLVGLGNLGQRFCELLPQKAALLADRYALRLVVAGAADSRGAAYAPDDGLDPALIALIKRRKGTVASYPRLGRPGWRAHDLVGRADAQVLLEASPVNLSAGAEPGITCIRTALRRGMHVVTPNKGPIVTAFDELHELAQMSGVRLRFDGTVAGGLPALSVGTRDLRGAMIERIEAVPNLSSGLVADGLASGETWDEAMAAARAAGTLEGDGAWDLDGWDAAAKLVIIANAVLEYPASMGDVSRRGLRSVDGAELRSAADAGCAYRLLATAVRQADGTYTLAVSPVALPQSHLLGRMGPYGMGVVYHTDIYGAIALTIEERDPTPSAATMLRDVLGIFAPS